MSSNEDSTRLTTTALLLWDPVRSESMEAATRIEKALGDRGVTFIKGDTNSTEPVSGAGESDVAIVIGGDGTMIAQARRLVDHDVPMIGVNCGRLGFLAPFSPESLIDHAQAVLDPDRTKEQRILLSVEIHSARDGRTRTLRAMNDGLVTAGEPFRMIRMSTMIDGQDGPVLFGDGLVIATPTGSTGHNASTGGPIGDPRLDALMVTPIAAQSLAFRPFALHGQSTLEAVLHQVNEGTSLVLDGQIRVPLQSGDRISFRRHEKTVDFVACPGRPFWKILHDKLGWAASPGGYGGDLL